MHFAKLTSQIVDLEKGREFLVYIKKLRLYAWIITYNQLKNSEKMYK